MPDTFFRNERRGRMHNVLVPNLYVRIFADGMVLFSIRVSLTLSCPMNLKLYPLDRQTCPMQIASCKLHKWNLWIFLIKMFLDGWATDDLVYIWKRENPVQIGKGISLPRFVIEKYSSDYCNVKTSTGTNCHTRLHLGFSAKLRIWQVPACKMEPQRGIILMRPPTHPQPIFF